jgi:aminoglycoside 3-N-acetyltransferase I
MTIAHALGFGHNCEWQKEAAMNFVFERLSAQDVPSMRALLDVYAVAFEDPVSYQSRPPSDEYLQKLLGRDTFFTVVAKHEGKVIAGLSAYQLDKFEQERSEVYIYDLAVQENFRRKGVARGLIRHLIALTRDRGTWVIFVQADHGDEPAIKLYESMGVREDVYHFDLDMNPVDKHDGH